MQPISERALKPIPTLYRHEEKARQAAISKRGKIIHRRFWASWWPSRDIKDSGLSGKNYALVVLSLLGYCNLGAYKK